MISQIHFPEIDSTNSAAIRLIAEGKASHGTLITADTQRQGRGRHSRQWISDSGNLFATLVLKPENAVQNWPQISFIMALAIADVLADLQVTATSLKWPNDVLVNGKKIAGILLEIENNFLIIGFGVNCKNHPDNTQTTATSLGACGVAMDPQQLWPCIIEKFWPYYEIWQKTGFAPIAHAWLEKAANRGKKIKVQQGQNTIEGLFMGIDAKTGELILQTDKALLVRISAGDVYIPNAISD